MWSNPLHLKESLMENFIFCAVLAAISEFWEASFLFFFNISITDLHKIEASNISMFTLNRNYSGIFSIF